MQNQEALQTVRPVGLAIDHIDDLLLDTLALRIPTRPIIPRTTSFFGNVNIFRVIQLRICAILYSIDDSGFQVDEERPGHVVVIVSLVEEHILAVLDLVTDSILLQDAWWTDTVLFTKLFPKLAADYLW